LNVARSIIITIHVLNDPTALRLCKFNCYRLPRTLYGLIPTLVTPQTLQEFIISSFLVKLMLNVGWSRF